MYNNKNPNDGVETTTINNQVELNAKRRSIVENNNQNTIGNVSDIELNAKNETNTLDLLQQKWESIFYKIKELDNERNNLDSESWGVIEEMYEIRKKAGTIKDDIKLLRKRIDSYYEYLQLHISFDKDRELEKLKKEGNKEEIERLRKEINEEMAEYTRLRKENRICERLEEQYKRIRRNDKNK